MQAGKLRWRVTLESPVYERDMKGQQNKPSSWTTVGTYWAAIRTATGREIENANQRKAQISHVVTTRYVPSEEAGRPILTPEMRFNFKGRHFSIRWYNNLDERNRQVDVYCEEKVST